jgi:hypothetical protein
MHSLNRFFEIKSALDQQAQAEGKPYALPAILLPYLADALNSAVAIGDPVFKGTREQLDYLLNSARIMAIFAVWEDRDEWIQSGVLALLFENGATDSRLTMVHLALLNYSSEKIGKDLIGLVRPLCEQVVSQVSEWVASFASRSAEARSLKSFGFKEILRGGKFDFKCEW